MLTVDPVMAQDTDGIKAVHTPEPPSSGSDSGSGGTNGSTDWIALVEKIRCGSEEGMAELYRLFSKGIRFYLCRQLGPQELDDKVHDTFLIVVQAIRRGDLREPERLMGFVRTVVRRQVAAYIDEAVQIRREQADIELGAIVIDAKRNPEEKAIGKQNEDLMAQVLRSMSGRDREILTRFYLHEQTQEQICSDMDLSETQFRLLKSRAKARFGELGKRRLQKKPATSSFLRTMLTAVHSLY
jgi:RNA polymerase sigma factor (sigma-70 family)